MATFQIVQLLSKDFQPKNDFILVQPAQHNKEAQTDAGIIIPINRSSLDRPTSGTVISVGENIEDINEGTFVLWPNTDGLDINFIDGDFILLQSKSIIGFKK